MLTSAIQGVLCATAEGKCLVETMIKKVTALAIILHFILVSNAGLRIFWINIRCIQHRDSVPWSSAPRIQRHQRRTWSMAMGIAIGLSE